LDLLDSHSITLTVYRYIYTGATGRNGRISVSVNDIVAAGCDTDPDRWTPTPPDEDSGSGYIDGASGASGTPDSCSIVTTPTSNDFLFLDELHDFENGVVFSVVAERDVHIALAPSTDNVGTQRNHEMYEIVIGMAGNSQSVIRRTKWGSAEYTADTENILRPSNLPTELWVRYDETAGTIEVGVGCTIGRGAFMSWMDPTPLNVSALGFSTQAGSGEWRYCPNIADATAPEGPCGVSTGTGTAAPTAAPTSPVYVIQYEDTVSSFNCEFDYRTDRTPTISDVAPINVTGATTITITGTNFVAEPTVYIGPHLCTVENWTATSLECAVPAMAAGKYYIKIHIPTLGYAAHPIEPVDAFIISSQLAFTGISPVNGSVMGGVTITIDGYGFAANNSGNDVVVDGRRAHVLNATHTQIVAVVPIQTNTSGAGIIVIAVNTDRANDTSYGQVTPHARRYSSALNHSSLVASTMVEYFASNNVAEFNESTDTWVTPGVLYASTHGCSILGDCSFSYMSELTPTITSVAPSSGVMGTSITINGAGFGQSSDASVNATVDVLIGNVVCVIQSTSDTAIVCIVGATPAGTFSVFVTNHAVGTAAGSVVFTSLLAVTSVLPSHGSYGGGQVLTIMGSGFAGGVSSRRDRRDGAWGGWLIFDYADRTVQHELLGTAVSICGSECIVTATTYGEVTCTTTSSFSAEYFSVFGTTEATPLTGTVVSSGPPLAISHGSALDGDYETFFEADGACHTGIDLGEGEAAVVTKVRWFPAHQRPELMINGTFELSADGTNWTTVHTIASSTEGWNFELVDYATPVRYARYHSPLQRCAIAMLEFVGMKASASGTCPIQILTQFPLSHPSLGPATTNNSVMRREVSNVTFSYRVTDTPTVTAIAPPYGSSLGGTLVTITGTFLPATASSAEVYLNSRVCNVQSASDTEITCITTARGLFQPLTVAVRERSGGLGYAVHNTTVLYRYLDRWSDLNTWLNDEPPVEGDTVVIPSDQAIIIDVPLPRLFLVLIQGFLMFDPNASVPLNLNAT
jgi:hypothetical protein